MATKKVIVRNSGAHIGSQVIGDHASLTSTVGASTIGAGAVSTSYATMTKTAVVSQAEYRRSIDRARKALIDDEAKLNDLSDGLAEALGQFLRIAREIQVDQLTLKDVQLKMKESLDDVWSQQVANKLKGQALPATLELTKSLLDSPVTAALAKMWLGG